MEKTLISYSIYKMFFRSVWMKNTSKPPQKDYLCKCIYKTDSEESRRKQLLQIWKNYIRQQEAGKNL